MAMVFATGKLWFKVPETIKFNIIGNLAEKVYAKDVVLNIIGKIGADGATYKACRRTSTPQSGRRNCSGCYRGHFYP